MTAAPTILDYALADEILNRTQSGRVAAKSAQTQQRTQKAPEKPSSTEAATDTAVDTVKDYAIRNYVVDPALEYGSSLLGGAEVASSAAPLAETAWGGYGATEAALGLGSDAAAAGYLTDSTGNAIGTAWGGASGTAGSGIFGANGATLGSAGVGLAALPVTALYGYQLPRTYANLTSEDSEKKWQGGIEAALLMSGVGSWLAPIVGGAFDLFDTGKPGDQQTRDRHREAMREGGYLTEDNQLPLATGGYFDVGLDGAARLQNQGTNIDGKTDRAQHDVDFSDPRSAQIVAALDPLMDVKFGGDQKNREWWTGYHTNAALSSGDPMANVRGFYANINPADIQKQLDAMVTRKENPLAYDRYLSYINELNKIYSAGGPR